MKCVLHNYHKKDVMYFEDGKAKFKIVPVKTIYSFDNEFKLGNSVDMNEMLLMLKALEDDQGYLIYDIDANIAGVLINAYFQERLKYDEYNKLLLDKNYHSRIGDRISQFHKTNSIIVSSLSFMRRKVLMPKSGVVILVGNENSKVESIYVGEKEVQGLNNIYFITRYRDGSEIMNSVIINENLNCNVSVFGNIIEFNNDYYNTLAYVFDFLNLVTVNPEGIQLKYEVISPVYWKYRGKNYTTENDEVDKLGCVIKREFEVEIAPYFRKINGTANKEAVELAKKIGVIIEDGYTIVKPHRRVYNKIK